MPQRRRVVLASSNELKVAELARSLSNYDIEIVRDAHAADSEEAIWAKLHERGEEYWHKAVLREQMRVFRAGARSLESFQPEEGEEICGELPDSEAVILCSRLEVFELPKDEAALLRENKFYQQSLALHTTPGATGAYPAAESPHEAPKRQLRTETYTSCVEAYVDYTRRSGSGAAFGWDDIVVLTSTGKTYQEMLSMHLKFSPRDFNVNRWLVEHIHYKTRKANNYINERSKGFSKTISFSEEDSVGRFVSQNQYFNNEV
ncbi:unnamed protein product, partial [Effrenium voratum]